MLLSLPLSKAISIRPDIALREYLSIRDLMELGVVTDDLNRYFCNPNSKSHIEVLPGTYTTEEEKKYPGINSGQYLVQRLAATY